MQRAGYRNLTKVPAQQLQNTSFLGIRANINLINSIQRRLVDVSWLLMTAL
jgi:hypothetical protein